MRKAGVAKICFYVLILSCISIADTVVRADEESSRFRGQTMVTPANQWREALPSGNGMIGALVYGSINEERILFNHNQLWYGGYVDEVPDLSAELPVVRKLMLEGKYFEANDHYRNKMT